jgi:hypothetical protein
MTTIAACPKSKTVVCDSIVSDADQKWTEQKVFRIRGSLYATAGESADGEAFLQWIRGGKRGKTPKLDGTFDAIALTPNGLFQYDAHLIPSQRTEPIGIGTGGKCAKEAMMAGADIVTAVEIACQIDAQSEGPVVTHKLKA